MRVLASSLFCLLCTSASALPQSTRAGLSGVVTDETGTPIEGAFVVASGAGFNGSALTNKEGVFLLSQAGEFVSVRHKGFNVKLIPRASLTSQARIALSKADQTMRQMPTCVSVAKRGSDWIGGGLRIKKPRNGYQGPTHGEHDAHWYVHFDGNMLHVVDGYAWHAGLPPESLLKSSEVLNVRGWVFGDLVGMDVSGRTVAGKRWRWIGAPIATAISYEHASEKAADFFDQLIASTCIPDLLPKQK